MKDLKRYLEGHENEMIQMLKEITEHESPSRNRELTNKLCDYLENLFRDIARVTRIVHHNKQQKVGDELKLEFGEGTEQVLIICHMDTVWEDGEILKRPFEIKDDKIYGPGIFDMKFSILQAYWALKALFENEIRLNYRVVLYIDSHEEIGSRMSLDCLIPEAKKSKCIFVMESSAMGNLKIQRKGIRVYRIRTTGRNAHAGGGHMNGINAIKELAYQIIDIENMTDYSQGITVNFGYMRGGREVNIIPDYAEAKFEVRYWTEEQGEKIDRILANLKPRLEGAQVEVSLYRKLAPLEKLEENVKLFRFVQYVGKKMGLELDQMPIGGVSDANRLANLGVPIIDGMGARGMGAHSKEEFIYKDCIVERTLLMLNTLIELSKCELNYKSIID